MFRARAHQQLLARRKQIGGRRAFVGFDGFVDTIVEPVGLRRGIGDDFVPVETLADFGARIVAAAGKSTNIELYPRIEKVGGNGPIMATALLHAGAEVSYVGTVGGASLHTVFKDLSERARVVSLGEPARTTALEFRDGKLMLGVMRGFDDITYDQIVDAMGIDALRKEVGSAHLIALVNWTMIPHMTAIFRKFVESLLPKLPRSAERNFFFDLCDPEKRNVADLRDALMWIARFEPYGQVTLGLNLKESQQVAAALSLLEIRNSRDSLVCGARAIREELGISCVVIHPRGCAVSADKDHAYCVPGPFTSKPKITTGAGDHFNAGFTMGQLLGLDLEACLVTGVATSGIYVRTGKSPSLDDVERFLLNWR